MSNENDISNSRLIDRDALEALQSIMEDEFIEIIQLYLEESITLMSDVHDGFAGNNQDLLRSVHTLKSSSKNVGAMHVGEIAGTMEALVKDGNVDSAKEHLDGGSNWCW